MIYLVFVLILRTQKLKRKCLSKETLVDWETDGRKRAGIWTKTGREVRFDVREKLSWFELVDLIKSTDLQMQIN